MNNSKCSNAMLAMADATSSMAADYEGQLQQLKQANDGLLKQVQSMANDQSKALGIFHALQFLAAEGRSMGAAQLCERITNALSDSPWSIPNTTPKNNPSSGSSGGPKITPTS